MFTGWPSVGVSTCGRAAVTKMQLTSVSVLLSHGVVTSHDCMCAAPPAGTIIEVNVSELGLVTPAGKVVWGKYAQVNSVEQYVFSGVWQSFQRQEGKLGLGYVQVNSKCAQ